jgi:hypothetical protein
MGPLKKTKEHSPIDKVKQDMLGKLCKFSSVIINICTVYITLDKINTSV